MAYFMKMRHNQNRQTNLRDMNSVKIIFPRDRFFSVCHARETYYSPELKIGWVLLEIIGDDAGTPAENFVLSWLKTWEIVAILGTSSGSFDFRGTFPSVMVSFTSVTNWPVLFLRGCCAASLK